MEDKNYFSMLPNDLFYNTKNNSLIQEFKNYKLLLVMDYLHCNTNKRDITHFTIADIVTSYGFKLDAHKGKINEQVRNTLEFLQFKNIIQDCNVDVQKIKVNEFVKCKYNSLKTNDKGDYVEFTTIRYSVMDLILKYKDSNIDNTTLLFYYGYLASRIGKEATDANFQRDGGKPTVYCNPARDTIVNDTGISSKTIQQYNDILEKIDLIRIKNPGLFYYASDKSKSKRESPNFYTYYTNESNNKYDCFWYNVLKEAVKNYKAQHTNMVFTNSRKYKNNNKSEAGFLGSISRLEKQGKATLEQLQKRDAIVANKAYKEETITALKDKIYDIQLELVDSDKEEKYEDILAEWEDYFDILELNINDIEDCKRVLNYVQDMKNKYILGIDKSKYLGDNLQRKREEN